MRLPLLSGLRLLAAGLFLGAAVGLAVLYGFPGPITSRSNGDGTTTAGFGEGSQALDFELSSVDGQTYRLSELRGNIVVLNFWATWCGPCRLEMPAFQARQEQFRDEGLVVLAINDDEPAAAVEAFGSELGLTLPLLLDPGAEVQRAYRIRAYPTTFFVDRQGVVKRVHLGLMTEGQMDEFLGDLGVGS